MPTFNRLIKLSENPRKTLLSLPNRLKQQVMPTTQHASNNLLTHLTPFLFKISQLLVTLIDSQMQFSAWILLGTRWTCQTLLPTTYPRVIIRFTRNGTLEWYGLSMIICTFFSLPWVPVLNNLCFHFITFIFFHRLSILGPRTAQAYKIYWCMCWGYPAVIKWSYMLHVFWSPTVFRVIRMRPIIMDVWRTILRAKEAAIAKTFHRGWHLWRGKAVITIHIGGTVLTSPQICSGRWGWGLNNPGSMCGDRARRRDRSVDGIIVIHISIVLPDMFTMERWRLLLWFGNLVWGGLWAWGQPRWRSFTVWIQKYR